MVDRTNDDYDKIIDIELKKKALENDAAMGSCLSLSPCSAELKMTWLDYIEKFERQYKEAKTISIRSFIGDPDCIPVDRIPDHDIDAELEEVMALLYKYHISVDTLCEVKPREMYRFVTEELFAQDIDNIHIEGMIMTFIYEDFHPNAQYDIELACQHFFTATLGNAQKKTTKPVDLLYVNLDAYLTRAGVPVERLKVESAIHAFLSSFDRFDIKHLKVLNVAINDEESLARLDYTIDYYGLFEGSSERMHYQGKGMFKLKASSNGGWDIYTIDLPGLSI